MRNTELVVKPGENAPDGTEKKTAGDYAISYRIGPAKGLYEFSAGKLEWQEPQQQNVHVDVIVKDVLDGRFLPGLNVVATLLDGRGGQAASSHLPFVWDPEQNHYGANVCVPESGAYLLQVHVHPATFNRTDKELGKRFVGDAHVSFENVRIEI